MSGLIKVALMLILVNAASSLLSQIDVGRRKELVRTPMAVFVNRTDAAVSRMDVVGNRMGAMVNRTHAVANRTDAIGAGVHTTTTTITTSAVITEEILKYTTVRARDGTNPGTRDGRTRNGQIGSKRLAVSNGARTRNGKVASSRSG
jgi:hypothetical protein